MAQPVLRFENVSIVFGNHPEQAIGLIDQGLDRAQIQEKTGQILGVADCSLEVFKGEIVVLMGLSGSGKSTLLRAANALNPIIRGRVQIRPDDEGGHENWLNPHQCGAHQLRQLRLNRISMVFQQFGLLPWRSVAGNVGLGLELAGMKKSHRTERIQTQLELVGLSDWSEKKVSQLSGGMQQRVGLARAFVTEAPIMLMDEPFSALDPLIRARLQDELLILQKRLNRTILFVSHDLDEAVKLGSRIAIMEGGRIVQIGTPLQIINRPTNQYVADFVADINPLSALTAGDVMKKLPAKKGGAISGINVEADQNLRDVIDQKLKTNKPLGIVYKGRLVGTISETDILHALIKRGKSDQKE